MPFILWSVQYATYSMSIKTRHHSTLDWKITKDVKDPKAILADKLFQKSDHKFNEQATFAITDRLTNTNLDEEILKKRFIQKEKFWIQKLEILYPKGLNQELHMKV